MSTDIIAATTRIPNFGERWFKQGNLNQYYYEPYLKPRYKNERKRIFPFSYLLDRYVPMMKIIMRYFTCEGRFSRLHSYHVQLLVHFTRVRMLNIPYYLYKSIEKMAFIAQKRDYDHQMQSVFHHSLIKMIITHHLDMLNIPWDTFISNDIFTVPPIQHVQDAPSSSHPSIYILSSQPNVHTSSLYQLHSPPSPLSHIDPSSSPYYDPSSPSHHDSESPNRDEDIEAKWASLVEVEPFPKTY